MKKMKKFKNNFGLVGWLLLLAAVLMGAKIGDDTLRIGAKTGADIEVRLGDGLLKWDDGTSKLQFSDDGVGFNSLSDIGANSPSAIENTTVATSVGSSAMTIDLKVSDGSSDPTGGSPSKVSFRDLTVTDGAFNVISTTGALTIVIPSGATLGHSNATDGFIYVYLLDNAGVAELAVSSVVKDESSVQTSVSISVGSDDDGFYSTTGRSNVPIRLIARLKSNQTVAGTWDADVTENTPGAQLFTDTTDKLSIKIGHNKGSGSKVAIVSAFITFSAGTPSISSQDGTWIASLTDASVGQTSVNFTGGFWAIAPRCWAIMAENVVGSVFATMTPETTSGTQVRGRKDTGVFTDENFRIFCFGVIN